MFPSGIVSIAGLMFTGLAWAQPRSASVPPVDAVEAVVNQLLGKSCSLYVRHIQMLTPEFGVVLPPRRLKTPECSTGSCGLSLKVGRF